MPQSMKAGKGAVLAPTLFYTGLGCISLCHPLHEDKLKLRMGTKFQRFPRALCTDEGGRSLDADSLSVFLIFPS